MRAVKKKILEVLFIINNDYENLKWTNSVYKSIEHMKQIETPQSFKLIQINDNLWIECLSDRWISLYRYKKEK